MSIISVRIDVKKLDKSKFFEGKNGAVYADIVLMENRDGPDQYGNDFMVVQSLNKQDREAGKRGAILGNAKYVGNQQKPQEPKPQSARRTISQNDGKSRPGVDDDDEIIPF